VATVLTDAGKQWLCDKLTSTVSTTGQYVAWGTGAGTAAVSDTTLSTEASEARVAGTVSTTGTGASAKYQVVATITANGTKTITNVGNFTASSVGTLIVHQDFTGVAVNSGDSLTFTITLQPT
jgi:hypothetical protein